MQHGSCDSRSGIHCASCHCSIQWGPTAATQKGASCFASRVVVQLLLALCSPRLLCAQLRWQPQKTASLLWMQVRAAAARFCCMMLTRTQRPSSLLLPRAPTAALAGATTASSTVYLILIVAFRRTSPFANDGGAPKHCCTETNEALLSRDRPGRCNHGRVRGIFAASLPLALPSCGY